MGAEGHLYTMIFHQIFACFCSNLDPNSSFVCIRYLLDWDSRHMVWTWTWRRGHDFLTQPRHSCCITKLWLVEVLPHIQHEATNQFFAVFSRCLGSDWLGIPDQRQIYSIDSWGCLLSDGVVEVWCPSFIIRFHPWGKIRERLYSPIL